MVSETTMGEPVRGRDGARPGLRPLILAFVALLLLQLCWGAFSCIDAAGAAEEPAERSVMASGR